MAVENPRGQLDTSREELGERPEQLPGAQSPLPVLPSRCYTPLHLVRQPPFPPSPNPDSILQPEGAFPDPNPVTLFLG